MIGAMILMSVLVISTAGVSAQNATTNASNAAGNMSASANRTASELGKNASLAVNKTGETLEEVEKNVSVVGKEVLNKTGEAAQKIGAGAASVFSNLTGEIKQGINNNSNTSK
jgi:outer membrane receptor protein involved in Fe transport